MKIKIISLGFFSDYNQDYSFIRMDRIQSATFQNIVFHFSIETDSQYHFKISPMGGFFIPSKAETYFYSNLDEKASTKFSSVLEVQPSFFVFLLPMPFLRKINRRTGYCTDRFSSIRPFRIFSEFSTNFNGEIDNNKLNSDLSSKIIFSEFQSSHKLINDFRENNCYPFFLQDPNELCILIDDYAEFFTEAFKFQINLLSFTKMVIPFFNIVECQSVFGSNNCSF
jgi:hypothetical protein